MRAALRALPIGITDARGVDYLLMWNFKYIINAETKSVVTNVVESRNLPVQKFVRLKNLEGSPMIDDPIVAEVLRHRREYAAGHGNDVSRIVEALRKRERESKRTRLNPGPNLRLGKTGI